MKPVSEIFDLNTSLWDQNHQYASFLSKYGSSIETEATGLFAKQTPQGIVFEFRLPPKANSINAADFPNAKRRRVGDSPGSKSQSSEVSIAVFVITPRGVKVSLRLNPANTIAHVKATLGEKGYSLPDKLIYAGQVLEDHNTCLR